MFVSVCACVHVDGWVDGGRGLWPITQSAV